MTHGRRERKRRKKRRKKEKRKKEKKKGKKKEKKRKKKKPPERKKKSAASITRVVLASLMPFLATATSENRVDLPSITSRRGRSRSAPFGGTMQVIVAAGSAAATQCQWLRLRLRCVS